MSRKERELRSVNINIAENGFSVTEDRVPAKDKNGQPVWEQDTPRVFNDLDAMLRYLKDCLGGEKSSKQMSGWIDNATGRKVGYKD